MSAPPLATHFGALQQEPEDACAILTAKIC